MNSRSLSTLAIIGFVMLGTICLGLRHESIGRDEAAREDTLWELTYDAHFRALASSGQAQVAGAVGDAVRYAALPGHPRPRNVGS